jgi:peptide/nickel transport system substrate-binding protein
MTSARSAFGFMLILLMTVVSCTSPTSTPAASAGATAKASASPKSGGTFVWGIATGPSNPLDMRTATSGSALRIGGQIYEPLYRALADGTVEPLLAEKTEVSSDGLTWTLTLRSGVKFHDGTDFDAAAVKTNLDIRRTLATFPFRAVIAAVLKEVKVVNPTTVQLVLPEPYAALRAILAAPNFAMQSPTAMDKFKDAATYAKNASGTGPFTLEGASDTEFRFVRNTAYWGPKAYLDKLILRVITEDGARVATLEAGDIQGTTDLPVSEFVRLKKEGKVNAVAVDPAERAFSAVFNTSRAPFNDKRVRQALVYAMNAKSYVGVAPDTAELADSILTPDLLGPLYQYAKKQSYPYDPAKAKQLLADAGVTPGPIEIIILPAGIATDLAQLVKQDWDRIGFQTTLKVMDSPSFLALVGAPAATANWQVGITTYSTRYGDPEAVLDRFFGSANIPAGTNWSKYTNPKVDTLLAQQRGASDPQARGKIFADTVDIVFEDVPMYMFIRDRNIFAITKSAHGFVRTPVELRFGGVWLD